MEKVHVGTQFTFIFHLPPTLVNPITEGENLESLTKVVSLKQKKEIGN